MSGWILQVTFSLKKVWADRMYILNIIKLFAEGEAQAAIFQSAISVALILIATIASKIVISKTPGYEKGKKRYSISLAMAFVAATVLVMRYGIQTFAVYKGIVFMLIMMYASLCDLYERKVANFVSVELLVLGFVETDVKRLAMSALAGVVFFVFMFITAMIANGKLGGADFKIISACAFVLGINRTAVGLVAGLISSVVITLILKKIRKSEDNSLPLVPYLTAGFLSSYIFL